jgi:hypothetical protein
MGGMFDFMENPHMGQYMGQMGMGLLAASQPQPYGVNRYSLIQNSMNQANQNLMRQQMFDMQKEEYEEKKKERMKQRSAIENLSSRLTTDEWSAQQPLGDPRTAAGLPGGQVGPGSITWKSPRQKPPAMSQSELLAGAMQVDPGAALSSMLAKPKTTTRMTEADALGYPRGSKEWKDYVARDKSGGNFKVVSGVGLIDVSGDKPKVVIPAPKNPTIAGVITPIMQKLAKGEDLTPGEKNTLDVYRRMSPIDRIMELQMFGDELPTSTPSDVPAPQSPEEYEAIPSGTKYQHPDDKPGTYRTKP